MLFCHGAALGLGAACRFCTLFPWSLDALTHRPNRNLSCFNSSASSLSELSLDCDCDSDDVDDDDDDVCLAADSPSFVVAV